MLVAIIVINHQSVQILMSAQLLHLARIPIGRIQGRRNRTMSDSMGTHHLFNPRRLC